MTRKTLVLLVTKHNGWMEGDIARFPTVHHKERFEKEWRASAGREAA